MNRKAIFIMVLLVIGQFLIFPQNSDWSLIEGAHSEISGSGSGSSNLTTSNSTSDLNYSVIQNGSIPHIYAYEDTPLFDALDLSEYFYNTNGAKLNYSFSTIFRPSPWVLERNGSLLSCLPYYLGPGFGNWFGDLKFYCTVKGTGDDGIWYSEDDTTDILNFTINLTVLPVNDDPYIEYLVMDGERYYDTGDGFNFTLEYDHFERQTWEQFGYYYWIPNFNSEVEIVWDDPDGDEAILIVDSKKDVLVTNSKFNISYNQNSVDGTMVIKMTDGNGSKMEEVDLRLSFVERYNYTLHGISFDGRTISEDGLNITLFEGETKEFYVHVENAPNAEVGHVKLGDNWNYPDELIEEGEDRFFAKGIEIHRDSKTYMARMYISEEEWDFSITFIIRVTILNINHPPNEPRIWTLEGPYLVDEEILFSASGSDPDFKADDLEYKWVFGDGEESYWHDYTRDYHLYDEPGMYDVTLFVRDPWGETNSTSFKVTILEPEEEDDSFIEKNTVYLILSMSMVFGVIMFVVLIMVLIGRIMDSKKGKQ